MPISTRPAKSPHPATYAVIWDKNLRAIRVIGDESSMSVAWPKVKGRTPTQILGRRVAAFELALRRAQQTRQLQVVRVTVQGQARVVTIVPLGTNGQLIGVVRLAPRHLIATARAVLLDQGLDFSALNMFATTPLSDRERDVVALSHLSAKDVAAELHLSHRTVENVRRKINEKLGIRNPGDLLRKLAPYLSLLLLAA